MTNLVQTQTTATILVKTLCELKVDSIFGYPGASVLSIYNELSQEKSIKHYLVRHEQAAVHAAEGYSRVSGKTGVVLVTSGPGFTNTVTGIANAYADSTPLVILAGDVADKNKEKKIFQNVDIESIAKSCCKKIFKLNSGEDVSNIVKEAFYTASEGVQGPVVIILPRNILEEEICSDGSPFVMPTTHKQNFEHQIQLFSKIINDSQKPVILLGGGCVNVAKEIEHFVSHFHIPVVSTLMGIGVYPSEHKLYMGMIGLNGTDKANSILRQADLLIALGTSFSDRSTCKNNDFTNNCKVVSINIKSLCQNCELQINAEVKEFIAECLKHKNLFSTQPKWKSQNDIMSSCSVQFIQNTEYLQSSFVLETLSEYTKYYEPVVVTDVGQHQMLTAEFFKFNKPRKFITSGGLGTMGFGLPAAIGAHLAEPDNLILNITGDGSFQMNLQELATCREHHIPIKIIIMNNSYLGMVRQMQEKIYNRRYQVEMINPDFAKIAEAYDLFAIRVKTKEELIPALDKAIKHEGTAIVDVVIDSFETI